MRRRADLASAGTYDCVEVGQAFPSFRQFRCEQPCRVLPEESGNAATDSGMAEVSSRLLFLCRVSTPGPRPSTKQKDGQGG